MRTKTLALSALLGMLGSASVMAQNVYSVNAVGYINVTIPPGFSIITCPLVASPDNTLNTIMPNNTVGGGASPSTLNGLQIFQLNSSGGFNEDIALSYSQGWANGGSIAINPGSAVFAKNLSSSALSVTFVGSVPSNASGSTLFTNVINPGYNLVGSIIPVTGDLQTSSILNLANVPAGASGESTYANTILFMFDSASNGHGGQVGFQEDVALSYSVGWTAGDPTITSVSAGFYFQNLNASAVNWVENFTLNP